MKRVLPHVRAIVLCLLITIFSTRASFSQSVTTGDGKFEVGLGFGPMFFLGDLGGSAGVGKGFVKDLDFPLTNLSKTLYASYYPAEFLGFRLAINHGVLKGNDAEAPNKGGAEVDRLQRNLSFKSSVFEGMAALEIYPTVFLEQYDGLAGKFRPYGVIGIGMFKMNPKAKDIDGKWVALQPLGLEGQGMAEHPDRPKYKLMQMEIPMGIGAKYYINEGFYVGIEVLHRKTFTDYIDDVSTGYVDPALFNNYLSSFDAAKASRLYYRGTYVTGTSSANIQGFQRGDPTENDAFFSTVVRFGWRLNSQGDKNTRRQMRCPVFY